MRNATILLLMMVLPLARGLAQQIPDQAPPVIVVSGSAQIEVDPDEATVWLGVVRQENSAQAAQEQANRAAQAVLAEMTKLGIRPQRVQTSRLTLSPVYAPPRPEARDAPRIAAYSASNTVSVELENLAQVGPVIDAGLRAGANQLEGVQFGIKNDLPVRQQALKQAVAEAHVKAESMAEALGVRLNGVQEASESGTSVAPKYQSGGLAMLAVRDGTPTPVSPGQLEVTATVTVKYFITSRTAAPK